jgi:hypothetical protein
MARSIFPKSRLLLRNAPLLNNRICVRWVQTAFLRAIHGGCSSNPVSANGALDTQQKRL